MWLKLFLHTPCPLLFSLSIFATSWMVKSENSGGEKMTKATNSFMLKCWDSICSPKACGGLGFRRMKDYNIALFPKLAWSIATNKDTLWVQLLKAKYLRWKSFLHDDITHFNASWIWSDVIKCRFLILKGVVYSTNIIISTLII